MRKFFNSFSIANKIAVVFILFFVMMGIGGSVGLYNTVRMGQVAESLYEEYFQRLEVLGNLEREFLSEREDVFYHVLVVGESSKNFIKESIVTRNKRILDLLNEFKALGFDGERELKYYKFKESFDSYRHSSSKVIALSIKGDKDEALRTLRREGSASFKLALENLKSMLSYEETGAFNAFKESKYLSKVIVEVTLLFTLLAIITAGILWIVVTRSIVIPIVNIQESAKLMAEGDLKQRANASSSDELGKLAEQFNHMAASLEELYINLEKKVNERTEELKIVNDELYTNKVELEEKNEELARSNQLKSQFLANVSHELRTPLNSIIGFSELLQEKAFGTLNEKQTQYVKYVHSSGEHLLLLINNILDLSKIEAGRMELTLDEITLSELIDEVVATIVPLADKRGIKIIKQAFTASPIIRADKPKLKQILINLLSNAVKFNVDKGTVDLTWKITEELQDMKMSKMLSVSITDTGIGIRKEDMSRLFREFEQLDPTITREYGGTGLGLSLTKKLTELHGGRIYVSSEYGEGCTFTIKIPQFVEKISLPVSGSGASDYSSVIDDSTYEERILDSDEKPLVIVAGESEDVNHLIEIYLGEDLYDVMTASDGEELLHLTREHKPFAVIIGVALSKKDGWEVLKELKNDVKTKDIEVVMISSADNKELGFALGALEYLQKPINKDQLLDVLSRVQFNANKVKSHEGPMKILVVDDEAQILTLMSDVLGKGGLIVLEADGGQKAIDMAISEEPDLIVLDLMMPDVSGFDVVDRLKKNLKTRNIPIVIFTAKDLTEDEKNRLQGHIQKVIQKASFKNEDLLNEVTLLEMSGHDKANMVDVMTRLFNKRYFDVSLFREIARSNRYGDNFSVLMVDMDNFKKLNSQLGKQDSDVILGEVANILLSNLRKLDIVTRYGGDEFAVIMPGTKKSSAVSVAKNLGKVISNHAFNIKGRDIFITVSISVMSCPVDGIDRVGEKLTIKAKELYLNGGNGVAIVGGK